MPQPYNYTVAQPQVSSYFDAFRQGRADRMAGEEETRSKSLAQYLPGALQGDEQAKQQALASASPDQQLALSGHFAQMKAADLARMKDGQAQIASMAVGARTPDAWALVNAKAKELFPGSPDIPFEQREMVIARAQTVGEQLKQALDEKSFGLQERQFAETARSNRATEGIQRASAARGAGGGNAPAHYNWGPPDESGRPTLVPIVGGGADPNRIAPGEGVKVRASNAQLDALEQSLNSYITDLGKTTAGGRIVSRGPEVSRVETGHTDLLMQMKNLYELGVLNGPDYMLMTKIVEDPTSFIQLARGTEGLKAQTDTVKSIITRSRNINNAKMGLPPTASAPPPPGGGAGAAPPPKLGETRKGYMFLGGNPADQSRWRKVAP